MVTRVCCARTRVCCYGPRHLLESGMDSAQFQSARASICKKTAVAFKARRTRSIESGARLISTSALRRFSVASAWHAWHSGAVRVASCRLPETWCFSTAWRPQITQQPRSARLATRRAVWMGFCSFTRTAPAVHKSIQSVRNHSPRA
jgi:hypothetical protein